MQILVAPVIYLVPDQVGDDVIASLAGNLSDHHSRGFAWEFSLPLAGRGSLKVLTYL